MTKNEFIKVYKLFAMLVKQEVNGEYCMGASCGLIDHCGGYTLEIRPDCLMWGREIAILHCICERYCLSLQVKFDEGLLRIL